MKVHCHHKFALLMYAADWTPLGQVAADVDWEPARQCAHFAALRRSRRAALGGAAAGRASVEPLWGPSGEPFASGFRICLAPGEGGEFSWEFGDAYFRSLAESASAYFVEKGKVAPGETVKFLVAAYPSPEAAAPERRARFLAEELEPPLVLGESSLAEAVRLATPSGALGGGLMPVVIPRRVLAEAADLCRAAGDVETGGILIGRLYRDSDPGLHDIFAVITAEIPARHARATGASLSFSSGTWTDVSAALAQRPQGEQMLGWWHSHLVSKELCRRDCPVERQRNCRLAKDFFSAHDHALHRAVFPQAFSVGLVVNDIAHSDPIFSLFGWNQGVLAPRGYYIKEE